MRNSLALKISRIHLVYLVSLFLMSVFSSVLRRAAFDIGSGATKLTVADVDTVSGTILKTYFSEERPCSFGTDWLKSSDNCLSELIQGKGIETLTVFKDICITHQTQQYSAIATEVFRKAKNGHIFLDKVSKLLDIPIQLVSQEIEAELGYATGIALYQNHWEQTIDSSDSTCIVWDSGGASFQFTAKNAVNNSLEFYVGAFGSGVVTRLLIESIRKQKLAEVQSPNPVSIADCDALVSHLLTILPTPVPFWLHNKNVVAIGGPNSIFQLAKDMLTILSASSEAVAGKILAKNTNQIIIHFFTADQVQQLIQYCGDKSDEELLPFLDFPFADPVSLVVPKLCLLYAVMKHLDINRTYPVVSIGSCAGLLISNKYW